LDLIRLAHSTSGTQKYRTPLFWHVPDRCKSYANGFFPRLSGRGKQLHHSAKEGEPRLMFSFRFALARSRWFLEFFTGSRAAPDRSMTSRPDGWKEGRPWILRSRRCSLFVLTDRSVVGVQVLGSHKLRHQRALADGGSAQHEDAIGRRTLGRAALPRARQRASRRISRRSRIRSGQVFRAASNRRKTRRVLRLAQYTSIPSIYMRGIGVALFQKRAQVARFVFRI